MYKLSLMKFQHIFQSGSLYIVYAKYSTGIRIPAVIE